MTRDTLREERRQQILAAATAVFARSGFHKASMNDIVKESGLSKGGLYWHFKSKDDIIAAVLEQFFNQEMALLNELAAADLSAVERLHLLTQGILNDLQSMSEFLPISLEFYALAARHEGTRKFMRSYYRQYGETLAWLVQQGIDAGEFRPIGSAQQTAASLIAQFEGVMLLWVLDPEAFDLSQQLEASVSLLLRGMQAGETAA
ncbi:MAG: TetR family transcriptional regulator [Anaerolineae bacterium]